MFVVLRLPGEGQELQEAIQVEILAQAESWAMALKKEPLPPIYSCRVRFVPEPAGAKAEEWADPYTTCRRGFGDCDDLVIWRLAEIFRDHNVGRIMDRDRLPAWPMIQWLRGTGRYHVLIRHRDGSEEDPAKIFLDREKRKR